MKKIIRLLCTLALCLTMLVGAMPPFVVSAATSGNFEYTVLDNGTAEITDYTGSATELVIPSVLDGYTVTSIGENAFRGCVNLTNVTIPDSVTSIGWRAFYDCTALADITISDSVTDMGFDVFYNTVYSNDESNWENDVLYLDCYLIETKNTLQGDYTVKDGIKTIADYVATYRNLTSITFPDSLISIGRAAFMGCFYNASKSINIPDGVTYIGWGAFDDCGLTSVVLPDSLTVIEGSIFNLCTKLTSVTLGDNVTSVESDAFSNCWSLSTIAIPDSVTNIGEGAFNECTSLQEVYYEGSKATWNAIAIGKNNAALTGARIHFGTMDDHFAFSRILEDNTCTEDGTAEYACDCGYTVTHPLPAKGHTFENNVCIGCNTPVEQCIASAHKYANNTDETWTIRQEGASSVTLTFAPETQMDENYDFLYIYDKEGNEVGCYTGTALASQAVTVNGDTVKIRLVTDDSMVYYGFAVTNVAVTYDGIAGDITDDGIIDTSDAKILLRYLNDVQSLNNKAMAFADCNKDGKVNTGDVRYLLCQLVS